jgi:ABC-type uncharacterized transport system permease subunit
MWLFLILAGSAAVVLWVGIAAYLRVRRHMKQSAPHEPSGKE